jgi:hypothetical protein
MAFDLLNLSQIASLAITVRPIAKMVNSMATVQSSLSANQSSQSPIELADRAQRRLFVVSVIFGVAAALIAALLTWLLWRANNAHQAAVKGDADARIAEAGESAARANAEAVKANEGLRGAEARIEEARAETAKASEEVARLTKEAEALRVDAEKARANIATAQADAAQANERTQRLAIEAAEAQRRQAEAERALLELQERIKPRRLTPEQRERLAALLRTFPNKGVVDVICQPNDAEAFAFAQELLSVFAENGWTRTGVIQWFDLQLRPGISLAIHSPQDAPTYAGSLQDTLSSIGLPAIGIIDPEHVSKGTVAIAVGPKP